MATSRKRSARPKSKPAKASSRASRASAKKSKPAARAAKKPVKAAKPVAKAAARPIAKTAATAAAKAKPVAVVKGGKPAKPVAPKGKVAPGKKGARPAVPETVRPLGVLPPESMARPRDRAPARPLIAPRPAASAPVRPHAQPQGDQPLTEDDLKYFEQRLLQERAKLMREMGHLENTVLKVNQRDSSGDLSGYSFHMADAGTDAYEREKAFLFASSEGRQLLEINEALRRLYGGRFGICEISGKPIARARLEALPWARYTLEVQEQLEKEERSRRSTP